MTREKNMTASAAAGKGKSGGPRLPSTKNPHSETPRIGRRFHRPSRAARARFRAIAQARGFAEPDVLLRWAEAVGPALSAVCRPVRVSYSGAGGATLLVRVDGAHAPEVEHSRLRIVERINAFYGYRAISRVKVTQATGRRGLPPGFGESPSPWERSPSSSPAPAEIAPEKFPEKIIAEAAALAGDIRDPGLRAAVARMGAWVLSGAGKEASS